MAGKTGALDEAKASYRVAISAHNFAPQSREDDIRVAIMQNATALAQVAALIAIAEALTKDGQN